MFTEMIGKLKCPHCDVGQLYYSKVETYNAWQHPAIFRLDDVDKIVDGIISEILVFICDNCEAVERHTFKEVELKVRKGISDMLFTQIAQSEIPDPGVYRSIDRTFIYCGKCGGFDGKGACPGYVYNECKLKRLPYGF
jgi:hypothetical protein